MRAQLLLQGLCLLARVSSAFIKLFSFLLATKFRPYMVFSNLLLQTDRSDTYETELVYHVLDWWNKNDGMMKVQVGQVWYS